MSVPFTPGRAMVRSHLDPLRTNPKRPRGQTVNLVISGFETRRPPRAGCSLARQAACKVVASAVGVRISPRPLSPRGAADSASVSGTEGRPFESGRGHERVAQWIEHRFPKPYSAGSSPAAPTMSPVSLVVGGGLQNRQKRSSNLRGDSKGAHAVGCRSIGDSGGNTIGSRSMMSRRPRSPRRSYWSVVEDFACRASLRACWLSALAS